MISPSAPYPLLPPECPVQEAPRAVKDYSHLTDLYNGNFPKVRAARMAGWAVAGLL